MTRAQGLSAEGSGDVAHPGAACSTRCTRRRNGPQNLSRNKRCRPFPGARAPLVLSLRGVSKAVRQRAGARDVSLDCRAGRDPRGRRGERVREVDAARDCERPRRIRTTGPVEIGGPAARRGVVRRGAAPRSRHRVSDIFARAWTSQWQRTSIWPLLRRGGLATDRWRPGRPPRSGSSTWTSPPDALAGSLSLASGSCSRSSRRCSPGRRCCSSTSRRPRSGRRMSSDFMAWCSSKAGQASASSTSAIGYPRSSGSRIGSRSFATGSARAPSTLPGCRGERSSR